MRVCVLCSDASVFVDLMRSKTRYKNVMQLWYDFMFVCLCVRVCVWPRHELWLIVYMHEAARVHAHFLVLVMCACGLASVI